MSDHKHSHCKMGHELTPENTIWNNGVCRECRICGNRRRAEWKRVWRLVRKRRGAEHITTETLIR